MLGRTFCDLLGSIGCRQWHRVFVIRANDSEDDQQERNKSRGHEEGDRLNAINSNVIPYTSHTDLGCPHNRAEDQDGKAPVCFGAILDYVRVHEHNKDGDRDDKGYSLPFEPKVSKRCRDADGAVFLLPNEDTSAHHVRGARCPAALLRQHLAPDGIAFPGYVLSLMDLELL